MRRLSPRRPSKPLDPAQARERALRLLARREHSARELKAKLRQRGAEPEIADAAVARLEASGVQSDQRYTESRVRQRAGHGYGPRRIRAELTQAGIDREAAESALQEQASDWAAEARALVQRRFPRAGEDRNEALRAWRWLAGRGFDGAAIRAALKGIDEPDADEHVADTG